jgi:polar amino acid transport system substrate-binding protein
MNVRRRQPRWAGIEGMPEGVRQALEGVGMHPQSWGGNVMRRRIAVTVALLAIGLFTRNAWTADTMADVKDKGVLVAGVRDDAPPFGFIDRDTGELAGIDVDLSREIANRLGVRLKLRTVTAAGWIPELVNGNADLIAATVTSSPERERLVDFSTVYFTTTQRIIAKKGTVASLKDLEGKRIGTGQDSATERNVRKAVPSAACFYFSDTRKAVEALRKGEIDALSASGANLYGCFSALPKEEYEIPGSIRLSESGYSLAVRKEDGGFLRFVNSVLAEMDNAGTAQKIFDKWFAGPVAKDTRTASSEASKAMGVVTRLTSTEGRYLVLPINGTFRPAGELSFYDPQGHRVGGGRVASIYEDEVYVDADDVPKDLIQLGFVAAMNYGDKGAEKVVLSYGNVIGKVISDARQEKESIQKQIAEESIREKKDRERYQEEITKAKMMLSYQYPDRYFMYYPYR